MSDAVILRVMSQAGRSRIEMTKNNKFGELKAEIGKRLGQDPKQLNMFSDQAYKKAIRGNDNDLLARAGLKHGDMIYISNQGAVMTQLPPKREFIKAKTDEELKEEAEKNKDKPVVLKDSKGRILKAPEVKEET